MENNKPTTKMKPYEKLIKYTRLRLFLTLGIMLIFLEIYFMGVIAYVFYILFMYGYIETTIALCIGAVGGILGGFVFRNIERSPSTPGTIYGDWIIDE